MARPKKLGLDYFPLECDIFSDERVVAIRGEFGLKGEITLIHLLCAIYRQGYFYEWGEMAEAKMAAELPGVSVDLLRAIVQRLAKWGFFDEGLFSSGNGVLTSEVIQRRYFQAKRFCSENSDLPYLLVSAAKTGVSAAKTGVSAAKTPYKEYKLKESTVVDKKSGGGGAFKLDGFLAEFFSESRRISREGLLCSLKLDEQELRRLAGGIVDEWVLTGHRHTDYNDAARHLLSQLRKKLHYEQDKNDKRAAAGGRRGRDGPVEPEGRLISPSGFKTL